ncbi:PREDICTED: ubiquitin carboxyl-terminal hydrolase CYLD isoform X1 [Nicrophorus vespilloides]|uniref:ubiquitinyl hydrolase 1 n=1 Tax=Nicrophorus vespilloides TaxID=110193 RepID=A0ABM1MI96_NICVS|nr:PREDICTED: ubiquitin carboxyl-terminal hydrolase CYLD isoform X1 [Nicrophorus vespilloides]
MESRQCYYGILLENDLVHEYDKSDRPQSLLLGQIIKIESHLSSQHCLIKVIQKDRILVTNFVCSIESILYIDEKLWPFLQSVVSPQDRVALAKSKERCQSLMDIKLNSIVGCNLNNEILLGEVKYMGEVKGIGTCYGIQLKEKRIGNKCNGSYLEKQYFNCLPGYGLFTTIDKLFVPSSKCTNDIDRCIQKNLTSFERNADGRVENGYNHNTTTTNNFMTMSHSTKNSLVEKNTVNTNNDFDQNTIVQSDNLYLLNKNQQKSKSSGVDLIDVIGSWAGSTDQNQLNKFSNLNKYCEKVENELPPNNLKNNNVMNGSRTVPRKANLSRDLEGVKTYSSSKFYINDLELNDRSDYNKKSTPSTSTFYNDNEIFFNPPTPSETNDLTVGSVVEVLTDVSERPLFGVVRWMGIECGTRIVLVGIELDEEHDYLPLQLTDGNYKGKQLFECNDGRALFVPINQCRKDSRFIDGSHTPRHSFNERTFGKDCPIIPGAIPPLIMKTEEDVDAVCGKFRGIQGHHNSCYLDATLFAMFTYTAVFDSLLFRPKGPNDISDYEEVQRVLREEIVNPLRKNLFVRADRVMNLRKLLDQLSSVSGLTSEEKDPEEFLNSLLAQILKAEPFLKLNSGQEAYHYQLFVEKDHKLKLPTVQQLFEQSFLTSDIKLKEVPSCLIIQMPRFGKNYKMYPRILPSQLLDVTDVIENSPRQCTVCGKLAKWECRECFNECGSGLESTAVCDQCVHTIHTHENRMRHVPKPLAIPHDFLIMSDHCLPPRLYMELFAVVCIETSHYVAFVKCGVGHEAPWCFFDSMADRKGERNGYNIPEMVACADVSKWLSDEQLCRTMHDNASLDRHLPEHARRLLCDAYICMYQSSDVMMYR